MHDKQFAIDHNAEKFWQPMAHPAESQAEPPIIVYRASGVEIEDIEGHRVLDGVGGLWCVNLGYSCQPVKDAIARQLEQLPYYNCFRGTTNASVIELAQVLGDFFAADGLSRAFFTLGGSDAVETALRLARQYHKIRGHGDRYKFIGLRQGYHGTNFGGASVNGNARFRRNYEPMLPGCFHIPCPWTYRNPFDESDPAKLAQRCAALLDAEIQFQGADTVAAFIMEPVLGAGGVIVPHASFMPMVREICDRHGVLLIADEVITALGRVGAWSGSRLWGVRPDMLCAAKGLTNGFVPLGAVLISDGVAEVFERAERGVGTISSGYTYSGHPVAAAAAIATIAEARRLDVAALAAARGEELMAACQALQQRHAVVGDVRGRGLMLALELVADRDTKAPLDPPAMQRMFQETYRAGAMVRVSGNTVIISPPLVIEPKHVQTLVSCLDAGLSALAR